MRRASAYRVFLTRNSEYHVRGHVCIGVRDRRSGHWCSDHPAVARRFSHSVVDHQGRVAAPHVPSLGDELEFEFDGQALRTSPVIEIEEREALMRGPVRIPRTGLPQTAKAEEVVFNLTRRAAR
jgi:hypothetical protein